MRSLGSLCFSALILASLQASLEGGLVIEVDPSISAESIRRLSAQGGDLLVDLQRGEKVIKLPPGALPQVALWARNYSGGPLVFSVEIMVRTEDRRVDFPPSTPAGLTDALFSYDAYHSSFACGQTPKGDWLAHPLAARTGDGSAFPSQRHKLLLHRRNDSPEAVWYRHLASRHASAPVCIGGQLTITAKPAAGAFPVWLEVDSHRYLSVDRWDRFNNTLSVPDLTAAALPYAPLRQDIEQRWSEYRKVFKTLDELSSLVEALAVMHAFAAQKSRLWNRFAEDLFQQDEALLAQSVEASWEPSLERREELYIQSSDPDWQDLAAASIGDSPQTIRQAELAIRLLRQEEYLDVSHPDWWEGIFRLAADSAELRTQLLLLVATVRISEASPESFESAARFLESVRSHDELFRLRIDGYRMLRQSLDASAVPDESLDQELVDLLTSERAAILEEFVARVSSSCAQPIQSPDVFKWEELSELVYSTGFLDYLAKDDFGMIDPEIVSLVACIHHRRGLAAHVGMDVFYRHAHFRFLKYLTRYTDDPEVLAKIRRYRADLAARIGLSDWEESDSPLERVAWNQVPDWSAVEIEGDLWPARCLFADDSETCRQSSIAEGQTSGILSEDGFAVLLIDSTLFRGSCSSSAPFRVRAAGLPLDQGRAFIPFRLEAWCEDGWQILEIPSSVLSGVGSNGNHVSN